jgi:hypothetical protein
VYSILPYQEKSRYHTIINDLLSDDEDINRLKLSLIEIMTLKCPTCKGPVDPHPDACSAIMCLSCGNYYCNYCFEAFSTKNSEQNRSSCHVHVALHNTSPTVESRDAFLSVATVALGHTEYRKKQALRCLKVAFSSSEYRSNGGHGVALALILCSHDLIDMGLSPKELWQELQTSASPSMEDAALDEHDVAADATVGRTGGLQLANAIISKNEQAIRQILESFDNLDVNYVYEDANRLPLASLAIFNFPWLTKVLLKRGADPMKPNSIGRSVLYIAIEKGWLDVVQCIVELNPAVNLAAPLSNDAGRYYPIHVAAR